MKTKAFLVKKDIETPSGKTPLPPINSTKPEVAASGQCTESVESIPSKDNTILSTEAKDQGLHDEQAAAAQSASPNHVRHPLLGSLLAAARGRLHTLT